MRARNAPYILLLSSLILCAASLKVVKTIPSPGSRTDSAQRIAMSEILAPQKFKLSGSSTPTNDGNFTLISYERTPCEGRLLVLPLGRNSEGSLILHSRFGKQLVATEYILEGRRYAEFPTFNFWWAQTKSAILDSFTGHSNLHVWAVASTAGCVQLESINWNAAADRS